MTIPVSTLAGNKLCHVDVREIMSTLIMAIKSSFEMSYDKLCIVNEH